MTTYRHRRITKTSYRLLSAAVNLVFLFTTLISPLPASAQTLPQVLPMLPAVGARVPLSEAYIPALLKGVKIDPADPLHFNFIIDTGNAKLDDAALTDESNKLIKYFLATLTTPDQDLWVNLSPYEKDRIVPEVFGQTEMGRDLLAQDYILKQLTSSLIYPEEDLGKEFWTKVRAKVRQQFGTDNLPVNTFNKVWVIPEDAVVYESEAGAYVVKSHLKVMLEADYVAAQQLNSPSQELRETALNSPSLTRGEGLGEGAALSSPHASGGDPNKTDQLASQVIREIILPSIEQEVNQGKNFATLRQIYHSMILATWYKLNLKRTLLGQIYVDQNKVKGVDLEDKTQKEKIYTQYLAAFKKGVFNYIKADYDELSNRKTPRKYFSGGNNFAPIARIVEPRVIKGDLASLSSPSREAVEEGGKVKGELRNADVRLFENATPQETAALESNSSSPIAFPGTTQWYINRLNHTNEDVRVKATKIIGEKGDKQAIKPLLGKLKDDSRKVRQVAVESSTKLGVTKEQFINAYIEALSSDSADARKEAFDMLDKLGYSSIIMPIIDEIEKVLINTGYDLEKGDILQGKNHVSKSITELNAPEEASSGGMPPYISVNRSTVDQVAIPMILTVLPQAISLRIRGRTFAIAYVPPVTDFELTEDTEYDGSLLAAWTNRYYHLEILEPGKISVIDAGDKRAETSPYKSSSPALDIPPRLYAPSKLITVMNTQSIYAGAIQDITPFAADQILETAKENPELTTPSAVLAEIKGSSSPIAFPGTTQWHINRLSHKNPYIRLQAVEELGNRGDSRALEPLLAMLSEEKIGIWWKNLDERVAVIKALGKLGNKVAIGPLTRNLWDDYARVRVAARMALEQLGVRQEAMVERLEKERGDLLERLSLLPEFIKVLKTHHEEKLEWRLVGYDMWDQVDTGEGETMQWEETVPNPDRGRLISNIQEIENAIARLRKETAVNGTDNKAIEETSNSSPLPAVNQPPVGGIDLNPAKLNLQIKRDGNGVPLPLEQQPIGNMKIDGFLPVIINITPLPAMPFLLSKAEIAPAPVQLGVKEETRLLRPSRARNDGAGSGTALSPMEKREIASSLRSSQ